MGGETGGEQQRRFGGNYRNQPSFRHILGCRTGGRLWVKYPLGTGGRRRCLPPSISGWSVAGCCVAKARSGRGGWQVENPKTAPARKRKTNDCRAEAFAGVPIRQHGYAADTCPPRLFTFVSAERRDADSCQQGG